MWGLPELEESIHDPHGGATYSMCPCCGFEFGYTAEDQGFSYESWRERWVADGMPWRDGNISTPPHAWDPPVRPAPRRGPVVTAPRSASERSIRAAMALLPDLSPVDVGSVESMLDGGEWVLAFEVMCEQAFEYDVPVSREALDIIRALGRELGAREFYADLLHANVQD